MDRRQALADIILNSIHKRSGKSLESFYTIHSKLELIYKDLTPLISSMILHLIATTKRPFL